MNYPITLEKALREIMPNERAEDRERIWRHYLVANQQDAREMGLPGVDDIAPIITRQRRGWFTESRLEQSKRSFGNWYPHHKKEVLKERAKKAAAARWEKKPVKKVLTQSKAKKKRIKHS